MHATINCCMHPEVFKIWIQVLNCNGACAASRNQQVLEKTTCCAAGFRLHTWKMLPLMNFMQIWQLFVSLLSWQSVGSLWLDHQGPFLYWQKHEAASNIYFTLSLWHIEDSQPDLETRTLDLLLLNSERTTWGKLWAKTYFFFTNNAELFISISNKMDKDRSATTSLWQGVHQGPMLGALPFNLFIGKIISTSIATASRSTQHYISINAITYWKVRMAAKKLFHTPTMV